MLSHHLSAALSDLQNANKKLEADIEREKKLEQARTDFFSAVSHELKTPVTVIKGQLEGMPLGIGVYKDREKYLVRSLETANILETMVQEILTITRLDAAGADFRKDCFDCVQVIQSRSRKTGGSGLGLYVTQRILRQHGSECVVCNTVSGVQFSFKL